MEKFSPTHELKEPMMNFWVPVELLNGNGKHGLVTVRRETSAYGERPRYTKESSLAKYLRPIRSAS